MKEIYLKMLGDAKKMIKDQQEKQALDQLRTLLFLLREERNVPKATMGEIHNLIHQIEPHNETKKPKKVAKKTVIKPDVKKTVVVKATPVKTNAYIPPLPKFSKPTQGIEETRQEKWVTQQADQRLSAAYDEIFAIREKGLKLEPQYAKALDLLEESLTLLGTKTILSAEDQETQEYALNIKGMMLHYLNTPPSSHTISEEEEVSGKMPLKISTR